MKMLSGRSIFRRLNGRTIQKPYCLRLKMKLMKVEEFLHLPVLDIPTERADGVDFYRHVLNALIQYEEALLQIENFEIGGNDEWNYKSMKDHVITFSRQLKIAIIKSLQAKQNENPAGAFEALQFGLENESLVKVVLSQKLLQSNLNLFRMRVFKNIDDLELKKIFSPSFIQ